MDSIGSIQETFHNLLEISLEWKIPEFFNLWPDVGYHFSSPSFEYCNETWQLVMYPNGRNVEGYSSIELWKTISETSFQIPVHITLGIRKADRTEEVILPDQIFPANDCDFWRADKFLQKSDLLRRRFQLVPWDKMTITCTLRTDEAPSKDGASEMTEQGSIKSCKGSIKSCKGSIREVCYSDKQIFWRVHYESLQDYGIKESPRFNIDDQSYYLKLQTVKEFIKLTLFRKGPSVDRNVVWRSGLKCPDGSYHQPIKNGNLHLEKECKLWTNVMHLDSFISWDLGKSHLATDGHLTFFFQMDLKGADTGEESSTHGASEMSERDKESIREEVSSFHKHVLWSVDYEALRERGIMKSPPFNIDNQSYLLQLQASMGDIKLTLFRKGPSVDRYVLWWTGLKRGDGSYHQTTKRGNLHLEEECKLWTKVNHLDLFSSRRLEKKHVATDGRITFFFQMNLEGAATEEESSTHGIGSVLFAPSADTMRGEVFISHENAEWRVYHLNRWLTSKEPFTFTSQEFAMGSQRYVLELSSLDSSRWVNVILHSRGPSVGGPSRFIRWWLKVVRGDGNFDLVKGELDLKKHCYIWAQRNLLHRTTRRSICSRQRSYRFPFHISTIDNKEADCLSVVFTAKSSHDLGERNQLVEMPVEGDGTIHEDECSSHKHVEWYIDNTMPLDDFTSPEFVIGTHRYRLKFTLMSNDLKDQTEVILRLISREPHIADSSQSIRWCAGLIMDKTYGYENGSGRLDLKEECDAWTQKLLHIDHLHSIEKFTIFFYIDNETKLGRSTECMYGFHAKDFNLDCTLFRKETCCHHLHVEWKPDNFTIFLGEINHKLMSTMFRIGVQSYMLEIKSDDFAFIELNLYTRGPLTRPSRTVRWWAGFKRADGTRLNSSTSGILDPGDVNKVWTHRCLLSVHKDEIRSEALSTNDFPTIFFRMNFVRAEREGDWCLHKPYEMFTSQKMLQKVEYNKNKQIECKLHTPERMHEAWWTFTSSEFAVGTQNFYFLLSCTLLPDCPLLSLHLYSRGPADTGRPPSARWCAGLKRSNGMYYHRNLSGKLALKEKCTLWTLRGTQQFVYSKFEETDLLSPLGQLYTVFFRLIEDEQSSSAATECIPGIVEISPTWGLGKIQLQESASYTEVKWTAHYSLLEEGNWNIVSPEFTIGKQLYILELSQDLNAVNSIILCLYRWGPSVTGPSGLVQWWAGLKRGNGTVHHRNQRGELDLKENCDLWTQICLLRVCRYRLEKELLTPDDDVTVFFRLSKNQGAAVCPHCCDVAQQTLKRLRKADNSDVVFSIKGEEFKMSKTIFQNQFPVFNAMFLHDTTEKRTGVVSIKDIEPAVFKELIHYVSTGFVQKLTAHNACALYVAAEKYLIEDLKAQCLPYMSNTLSVQSFFDVVILALRYGEDDLMKDAIGFLSGNKNVTKTDTWQKFYNDNTEAAKELQMRAFLPL